MLRARSWTSRGSCTSMAASALIATWWPPPGDSSFRRMFRGPRRRTLMLLSLHEGHWVVHLRRLRKPSLAYKGHGYATSVVDRVRAVADRAAAGCGAGTRASGFDGQIGRASCRE